MILPSQNIARRCQGYVPPMIFPYYPRTRAHGLTFGQSPSGYDIRIAETIWVWPGCFRLASSAESFDMPHDVMGIVHDKSTWARLGLCVQNTVIEPGWGGWLTLELTMHAFRLIRIKAGTPIAQVVFHLLQAPTEQPYEGKYQNQGRHPQAARFDKAL